VRTVQSDIESTLGIRQPTWFAIADTLSLTFSGTDAELICIDAYSNIERWVQSSDLPLPGITGAGSVYLARSTHGSDRIDLGIVPKFRYSPGQHRLRIDLGPMPSRYYQVSTCLFVGLDDEGLAALDLGELQIV
jgi:hypothetical protein